MQKKLEALLTHSITVLLLIITGFVTGLLTAAIHFIPKYSTTLTFADIGGMLAGIGTIGLLVVAILSINSWKHQVIYQENRKSLSDWYIEAIRFNRFMKLNLAKDLSICNYHKEELDRIKEEKRDLKTLLSVTKDIDNRIELRNQQQSLESEYKLIFEAWTSHNRTYIATYFKVEENKLTLENKEKNLLASSIDPKKLEQLVELSEYFSLEGKKLVFTH